VTAPGAVLPLPTRLRLWALRRAAWAPWVVFVAWPAVFVGSASGLLRWRGLGLVTMVASFMLTTVWIVWARWQRDRAVREAPLPQFLKRKLREAFPHLTGKDCDLVERGLRQFFLANLRAEKKFVAMPSRVVDAMWHEFILHTRAYRDWCELTLGWFLHHTPAEALGPQAKGNDGLRRAWYWACRDEAIHPRRPTRLPLLFALDAKLKIANGFHYQPDCRDIARQSDQGGDGGGGTYCGTDFGSTSFSGDAGSMGGGESCSGSDAWGGDGSGGNAGGGGDGGGGCGGGGD
jgi:hypothetical protein